MLFFRNRKIMRFVNHNEKFLITRMAFFIVPQK